MEREQALSDGNRLQPVSEGEEILVALDGGGTRTRCAAFDRKGVVRAEAETGPSNHLARDEDRGLEPVRDAISTVLQRCGARSNQVRIVSAGLAGVDLGGEGLFEAREFLQRCGFGQFVVSADIVTAHAGALGGKPGILALSGTGAVFYGVTVDGEHRKAGGWGAIYGDEGSAYWIGQMALRAASAAYDGRRPKTLLIDQICEALGLRDFSETLQCIYRSHMRVRLIADLSRTTEAAAAAGDTVALEILRKAGDELSRGVQAVAKALSMQPRGTEVTWEGSVLRNSELVRAQFITSLERVEPALTMVPPRFDPVYGAYLIGCKHIGWEVSTR